jgi:hypothetical protein
LGEWLASVKSPSGLPKHWSDLRHSPCTHSCVGHSNSDLFFYCIFWSSWRRRSDSSLSDLQNFVPIGRSVTPLRSSRCSELRGAHFAC